MKVLQILSVAVFSLLAVGAEVCTRSATCQCKTTSGVTVDLSSVTPSTGWFTVMDGKLTSNTYFYSPCKTLDFANTCPNLLSSLSSICQKAGNDQYDAGDVGTDTFAGDPSADTLTVTYTTPVATGGRISKVRLMCADETVLQFVNESPTITYNFELLSKLTCQFVPKSPSSGLSTGSIMVIIFFVVFLIYWIGGFLFMKFVRRAEGKEAIPNYEFWKEIPLLIRDGMTFTFRGCKGETAYQKI